MFYFYSLTNPNSLYSIHSKTFIFSYFILFIVTSSYVLFSPTSVLPIQSVSTFFIVFQVWDFKTGALIETIPFPSEKGAFLYCARFLSDELIAAGGSGTKDLKLIYRHTHEVRAHEVILVLHNRGWERHFVTLSFVAA